MMKILTISMVSVLVVVGGIAAVVTSPFSAILGIGTAEACAPSSVSQSENSVEIPASAGLYKAIAVASGGDPRLAGSMYFGTGIEANWNPKNISGDGAFGAWQIQSPGLPYPNPGITVAQAMDPVYSTQYMLPRYRNALNNVDPGLWVVNPEKAVEQTAYNAERPKYDYYVGQKSGRVPEVFAKTLKIMESQGLSTEFAAQTAVGSVSTTVADVQGNDGFAVCNVLGQFDDPADYDKNVATALKAAKSQLGVPYVWGGTSPGVGLDCSGLTQWSYAQAGVNIPRTAGEQWQATKGFARKGLRDAKPGDLIFFVTSGSYADPGHVGMIVGNHVMINAPRTGATVRYEDLTQSYWAGQIVGITDPFAWAAAQKQG